MNRILLLLLSPLIFSCETTGENVENKPPTEFSISVSEIELTSAKVSWTESKDPEGGGVRYDLYLENGLLFENMVSLEQELSDLIESTAYEGKIIARDNKNNTTLSTFSFSTNEPEIIENKPPTEFTISTSDIKVTSAKLSWTESKDPEGGEVRYDLYLENHLLFENMLSLEQELTDLIHNTAYEGKVVARDDKNNLTESTFNFSTNEPRAPTAFEVVLKEITETTVDLQWEASVDPEGSDIKYSIYLDGGILAQGITELEYSITGLTRGTPYSGKVIAENSYQKTTETDFFFETSLLLSNLKAHYDFCGNADDETGSNHGTIVGSVTLTQDRKGNASCAYLFPGTADDYIEVPYSEDFNISSDGSFSISLWYQGNTDEIGDLEYFLVKENELVEPLGTDYHLGLYDCNNPSFGSRYSPIAFAEINSCDGEVELQWRHVVATYNNQKWTIYVDNALINSTVSDIGIFQSNNGIKIGKYFQGTLDDIRFYSNELTEQDVEALYEL